MRVYIWGSGGLSPPVKIIITGMMHFHILLRTYSPTQIFSYSLFQHFCTCIECPLTGALPEISTTSLQFLLAKKSNLNAPFFSDIDTFWEHLTSCIYPINCSGEPLIWSILWSLVWKRQGIQHTVRRRSSRRPEAIALMTNRLTVWIASGSATSIRSAISLSPGNERHLATNSCNNVHPEERKVKLR